MLLKQTPKDFIVEEIPFLPEQLPSGPYLICRLGKINRNTKDVCNEIARQLKLHPKNVGFAGLKDKVAVTTQYISIKHNDESVLQDLDIDNTSLTFLHHSKHPIKMGDLKGNKFTIVIRELHKKLQPLNNFINYFGSQRFSKNNHVIGRHLIKQEFKQAVQLLSKEQDKQKVKERYEKLPTDPIGALRLLPTPVLSFYVAAYQAQLWNEMAQKASDLPLTTILPVPGFMSKPTEDIKEVYEDVLHQEELTKKSFVIRSFPEVSAHGDKRQLFVRVNDLTIKQKEDIAEVSFSLPKSSYATVFLQQLYDAS